MKCAVCNKNATYFCSCKKLYLCDEDLGKHIRTEKNRGQHPFEVLTPISENESNSLKTVITRLIKDITTKKSIILKSTIKNIKYIKESAKSACQNIDMYLSKFIEIKNYSVIYFNTKQELKELIGDFNQINNSIIPKLEQTWMNFFIKKSIIPPPSIDSNLGLKDSNSEKTEANHFFNNKIGIFLKNESGRIINISVKPLDTIEDVKLKLQYKEGIPPDQTELRYLGKFLKNEITLTEYNILSGSTINSYLSRKKE